MNKWVVEHLNLLTRSLGDQIKKATSLAQSAIDTYAHLQNQYDTNVILSKPTNGRDLQNLSMSTTFGNDDDELLYVPEFTFLAGSRLRYNRTLPFNHDDPFELVNFQTLNDRITELENIDYGATREWVEANFVGLETSGFNRIAYDSNRLGGIPAASYLTTTALATALDPYLLKTAIAADSLKLGGIDGALYALKSELPINVVAPDSNKLGGQLPGYYVNYNTLNTRLNIHQLAEDFYSTKSILGDFYNYNFTDTSIKYGTYVKLANLADINHYGVVQFYSKVTTDTSNTVPYNGVTDPTTYSVGYYYGGPVYLNVYTDNTITYNYNIETTFYLDNITNCKFVVGLTQNWHPDTGLADEGIYCTIVNGILTGNGSTGSTNTATDNYTCSISKWYRLSIAARYVKDAVLITYILRDTPLGGTIVNGTGTITCDGVTDVNDTMLLVGTGTLFLSEVIHRSASINCNGQIYYISEIIDDTHMRIFANATSNVQTNAIYTITKSSIVWIKTVNTNLPLDKILYLTMGAVTNSPTDNNNLVKIDNINISANRVLTR